eukprot:1506397-Pyramimonas_sp.AAC.1
MQSCTLFGEVASGIASKVDISEWQIHNVASRCDDRKAQIHDLLGRMERLREKAKLRERECSESSE